MSARCSPKIREQFLFSFKIQRLEKQFFYYESWVQQPIFSYYQLHLNERKRE